MNNFPRYDSYKDSGVEWLGEVPEHWEVTSVKHLLEIPITDGPHTTPQLFDKGIPFISAEAIKNGEIDFEKKRGYISVNDHNLFSTKYSPKRNDIYMVKSGATTGNVAIVKTDEDFSIWSPLAVFRANRNKIAAEFLFYLLQSYNFRKGVELSWSFGTQQNIGMGVLSNLPVQYGTLSEQTAIAEFLDRKTAQIEQAIAQKERLIELLKERRQILIHKAVTRGLNPNVKLKHSGVDWIGEIPEHWKVKRLKDICLINQNSLPENTNKNFEFDYVDIGSVTFENGIIQTEAFIFKDAPSRARRIAKKDDTVVSTVRTYLKAIDFIDEEKSKYIYSTGFAVLEPKVVIYPMFLACFVRSDAFTNQVTINSKGMSYPAINSSELSRLCVMHCGLDEQKEIVTYVENISAKIETAISCKQKEIEKLKEYKAVLINSAVTGKIKVEG